MRTLIALAGLVLFVAVGVLAYDFINLKYALQAPINPESCGGGKCILKNQTKFYKGRTGPARMTRSGGLFFIYFLGYIKIMFRGEIKREIEKTIQEVFPALGGPALGWSVESQENPEHGDYSSNIALVLAKNEGKNPREVAEELKNELLRRPTSKLDFIEKIETAGPGFLNFFIAKKALVQALGNPVSKLAKKQKINIEFVSANPTGPLTMANGRGGFYGDALANILEASGHKVTREYYINDAGNQIKLLGESIQAAEGNPPAGGPEREAMLYKGEYIKKLKGKTAKQAAAFLLKEIKNSLKKADIKFDAWFSEASMRKKGELKKTLELLNKKKTDLRGDAANIEKIKQLSAKHSVNLDNYPDIRGLKLEILPYILSGGGLFLILLGFELYRHKHKRTHEQEMHELAASHQVQQPSQELYNLQQYVKSCIERGYPKESIRKVLLDKGWDDMTIIQVLNSF